MSEKEAREIIDMIEGGWRVDFGPSGRELWLSLLLPVDARLAAEAVCELGKTYQRAPAFADVRSVMAELQKRKREEETALPAVKPTKTPEWVWVWAWARSQGEERSLPQQQGDPTQTMSSAEYEELHKKWVKAGRPRPKIGALSGALA